MTGIFRVRRRGILLLLGALLLVLCSPAAGRELDGDFYESAKGSIVTFYGWGGDPQVNRWFDKTVAPLLKERFGVTLKRVGMNIDEILNKLHGEKIAGHERGTVDVIWLNGENFAAAQAQGLLYGPFTERLPHFRRYVDASSPAVAYDFGTPTEGYEAPFGSAQLVFFADTAKIAALPGTPRELLQLAEKHPGRIAYAAPPDFTGSAFVRTLLCNLAPQPSSWQDEAAFKAFLAPALEYLNVLAPFLHQQGRTYVPTTPQLLNMYADGEVLIGMSYTPFLAFRKTREGEFPPATRSFVFEGGTVANTHFLAIPFNAPNKEGAMLLIDLLLSPQLQASKMDPANWGDLSVLDWKRLSEEEKALFEGLLSPEEREFWGEIRDKQIPELPASVIPKIDKAWLEKVPAR